MLEVWAGLVCPLCDSLIPMSEVTSFDSLDQGDVFVLAKARVLGAEFFEKIQFDYLTIERRERMGLPVYNAVCLSRDNAPMIWAQDARVVRIGRTL